MSTKPKSKKTSKKAKAAPAPEPTVEETTVPAAVEEVQDQAAEAPATQDAQAPDLVEEAKAAPAPEPAPAVPATVMVIVGPNGQAGRIVLGQTVYDGVTPRRMALKDFEAMRALYDLQEVEDT